MVVFLVQAKQILNLINSNTLATTGMINWPITLLCCCVCPIFVISSENYIKTGFFFDLQSSDDNEKTNIRAIVIFRYRVPIWCKLRKSVLLSISLITSFVLKISPNTMICPDSCQLSSYATKVLLQYSLVYFTSVLCMWAIGIDGFDFQPPPPPLPRPQCTVTLKF